MVHLLVQTSSFPSPCLCFFNSGLNCSHWEATNTQMQTFPWRRWLFLFLRRPKSLKHKELMLWRISPSRKQAGADRPGGLLSLLPQTLPSTGQVRVRLCCRRTMKSQALCPGVGQFMGRWQGDASGELGQQGQGSGGSKHSCLPFAMLLFPHFHTVCLFSPHCLKFQCFSSFHFFLTHSHSLLSPCTSSPIYSFIPLLKHPLVLVSIKQRWMEAPARPVTPSAGSGRGLRACRTAAHSLVPPKSPWWGRQHGTCLSPPRSAASCATGNQALSHKPVAFHYFNILRTFVSQLHHYSQGSPSVIPSPSQGFFGTLGRLQAGGSTTIKWGFPSLFGEACSPFPTRSWWCWQTQRPVIPSSAAALQLVIPVPDST